MLRRACRPPAARLSLICRGFRATPVARAKVLAVLYPDPLSGYPPAQGYLRETIPKIFHYPDGSTTPSPSALDFKPGELLGCVSGELGLRKFLESLGHELVVTADKEGSSSRFECELPEAEYVISSPFWPAYMTRSRMEMAPKLKACITAGVGSDHVNLEAAMERGVDVMEVSYCNSISVAEHVVLSMLALTRNFVAAHDVASSGGWQVADISARAYDIEGMHVGTVAAGRIGLAVMQRLKPFGVRLHYADRHRLPFEVEKELGATYWSSWEEMAPQLDVLTLNCPLYPETERMLNARTLATLRRGAFVVNTARGKLADTDAVVAALKSGQLGGYAGDVWFPQPPDRDHVWRTTPGTMMVPHISGTTLSAQV